MTLIAAAATGDGGVWMGGDRWAGEDPFLELAGPKVFEVDTGDVVFGIGFAGSPRVAQTILAVQPPARQRDEHSLHWWLTEYCDRIRERCEAMSLLCDPHDGDGAHLAGHTHALLGIEGRVVKIGSGLSWEEPARGWQAIGCAFETFAGAFTVLRDGHPVPDAARAAWTVAEQFHHIGPLADELVVAAAQPSSK